MNVTFDLTWQGIRADARRYPSFLAAPGFWVSLSYRVRRLRKAGWWPWRLLLVVDVVLGMVKRAVSDTTIPSVVEVGPGLFLPHPQGIIINGMARIGAGVAIFHQVTLGEWRGRAPTIGDGVAIFGGAKVFGDVTVGSGSQIGANAVVARDVPGNSTVSAPVPEIRTGN